MLADDMTVHADSPGVCTVRWISKDDLTPFHLSDTLVLLKLTVRLLSVPTLVDKKIGVIFLHTQGLLVDLESSF